MNFKMKDSAGKRSKDMRAVECLIDVSPGQNLEIMSRQAFLGRQSLGSMTSQR